MKCRAKVQKINETTTIFCFFYIKKEIVTLGIGNNLLFSSMTESINPFYIRVPPHTV
jgi:hypothetical protein